MLSGVVTQACGVYGRAFYSADICGNVSCGLQCVRCPGGFEPISNGGVAAGIHGQVRTHTGDK